MRHYDIASVKTGTVVGYPAKPLKDLSLEEIKNKYLKYCAKSYGDVSVCSKCQTPCAEGKRAIQLTANQIYNDPPIPLYGGKTLIEKAREENMLRKQKKEEQMEKKSKDNRLFISGWYEKAMASEDPVKWVQDTYGIEKKKAQAKLYQWRIRHNDKPVEEKPKEIVKQVSSANIVEEKLDALMKLQEKHKKVMIEMEQQYLKAKEKYDEINKKIDILCNAMDIMNE